jgi:hypothetical protein
MLNGQGMTLLSMTRTVSLESKEISNSEKEVTGTVDSSSEKAPQDNAQEGVKRVEAITLTWTKNSLITVYVL